MPARLWMQNRSSSSSRHEMVRVRRRTLDRRGHNAVMAHCLTTTPRRRKLFGSYDRRKACGSGSGGILIDPRMA